MSICSVFAGEIYPFITIRKYNQKYDLYEYEPDDLKIVECYHAYSFEEYKNKAIRMGMITRYIFEYVIIPEK